MEKKQNYLNLAIVFTLLAIATHLYLANQHHILKYGNEPSQSLCNVNETFNCDSVNLSDYSSFLNIPMAAWGASANAILLILLIMFHLTQSHRAYRFSQYLAGFILLMSLIMGFISFGLLSSYCLFCIATYIFSVLQFYWISKQGSVRIPKEEIIDDLKGLATHTRSFALLLLAIPVAAYVGNDIAVGENIRNIQKEKPEIIARYESQKSIEIDSSIGMHYGASQEEAKVHIVEFADFGCIHCKNAAPPIHKLAESYPGVRLSFLHFPLDGRCNDQIERPGITCNYAKAIYCASKINLELAWEAHKDFFQRQGKIKPSETAAEVAKILKVEEAEVQKCMDSEETQQAILAQAKLGADIGIKGTPAIYINGKKYISGHYYPFLKIIYDHITKE